MKILVFTEGTLTIFASWIGFTREEMVRAVKEDQGPADFSTSVPVGNAVQKLQAWQRQGAQLCYLTSRTEPAEIQMVQAALERHHFPPGPLYFRQAGEEYSQVAERVLPDVLVEDDCESIGGEVEMTFPHIQPALKRRIKSIIIPEFGGIDHLPDDIIALSTFKDSPMTDAISPELFSHLVQLAALELPGDEAEYLRSQLNKQLKAIDELQAIPLDEATPVASHGVPYTAQISPPFRSDEWQPDPHPEEILAQAPETDDGYIVVPEIPHTDLE